MCVASISLSSCTKKDVGGNPQGGTQGPDLTCKPGDDFYTYANAEWLKSLEGADPQKYYGWGYDIEDVNNERIEAIMASMPEYATLYNGVANREKNFEESVQLVVDLVTGMFENVSTREEVYVLFGQAIRMGIPTAATLHTGICYEDNTIGYYFMPPVIESASLTGVHSEARKSNHREPSQRLNRYVQNTRSGKSTIDYILEGIGLDPQYYLYNDVTDQIVAALEQMPLNQLAQSIAEAIQIEPLIFCSDEYAYANSGGKVSTVKECIDNFMEKDLGYFTSYYYSQKYPTDSAEPAFSTLGNDLAASFRNRLEKNQWLSPSTQQAALEKLSYMGKYYGTPKKWPVTEMPELEGKLLVSDVMKIKESRYNVIASLLGKDAEEYITVYYLFTFDNIFSYTNNAGYDPAFNSYYVLPPFMMEPAYSADIDECKFCAIIGTAIGHEMTHGFDLDGATYDKNGEKNNWWTADDFAEFTELNERVIENISTFDVLPGLKANGAMTVTEDVADLGGFNIAYDLWVNRLKERGVTGDELIEQKKKFFLNFAILHSNKIPVDDMIEAAQSDVHSAGHIRINSVVQQIDDWYELFGVTEGDALYLAPEKRITIW